MKKNYNKIILQTTNLSEQNDINWTNLLKLPMKSSFEKAKKILKKINLQDKKNSKFVSKLS